MAKISRKAVFFVVILLASFSSGVSARKVTHEVIEGETLSEIAKRYQTTSSKIRKLNKIAGTTLKPGQKLRVETPVASRSRHKMKYTIKAGDNPAKVAKKYKMTALQFRRMNPKARGTLRPGQKVWVVEEGPMPFQNGKQYPCLETYAGFSVTDSSRACGTVLTLNRVAEVLFAHHLRYPDAPQVIIGDISRHRGGFLAPHRSHRRGRDVDIRYPLTIPTKQYVNATPSTLDVERTWDLVSAFIKTGDVVYVFVDRRLQKVLYEHAKKKGLSKTKLDEYFQYPRSGNSMSGIIRHEPGHGAHFHVRFRTEGEPQVLPTS